MRKLDEQREVLYVIRTLDVLMSSGVGLEAAIHTIGSGGYGIISEDFSSMMARLRKGNSRGLGPELKSLMNKLRIPTSSKPYANKGLVWKMNELNRSRSTLRNSVQFLKHSSLLP